MPVLSRHGEDAALGGLYLLRQPLPDRRAQRNVLVSRASGAHARASFQTLASLFLRSKEKTKGGRSFDTPALVFRPSMLHSLRHSTFTPKNKIDNFRDSRRFYFVLLSRGMQAQPKERRFGRLQKRFSRPRRSPLLSRLKGFVPHLKDIRRPFVSTRFPPRLFSRSSTAILISAAPSSHLHACVAQTRRASGRP